MKYKTSKMRYLVSCIILNFIFLAKITSADSKFEIQPAYDYDKSKIFELLSTLELTCNVTTSEKEYTVVWYRDSEAVTSITNLKNRIKLDKKSDTHLLKIEKATEDDVATYNCTVLFENENVASALITSASKTHVKLPSNVNVVEGEKLRLHCAIIGKPPPRLVWEVKNEILNITVEESVDRYKLQPDPEHNIPNAVFLLERVEMTDRGHYKCIAKNNFTNVTDDESESFVRVKDKLAALWPFLGICAEVFILCAIILIYEKKRNKQELDESDTDQSPDQKNTPDHGKDSDVRHRK